MACSMLDWVGADNGTKEGLTSAEQNGLVQLRREELAPKGPHPAARQRPPRETSTKPAADPCGEPDDWRCDQHCAERERRQVVGGLQFMPEEPEARWMRHPRKDHRR